MTGQAECPLPWMHSFSGRARRSYAPGSSGYPLASSYGAKCYAYMSPSGDFFFAYDGTRIPPSAAKFVIYAPALTSVAAETGRPGPPSDAITWKSAFTSAR